jgi:hypothetical protein
MVIYEDIVNASSSSSLAPKEKSSVSILYSLSCLIYARYFISVFRFTLAFSTIARISSILSSI